MTLEEAQKQVDSWIKEYGVRYFSELTNMAILTEEVGELARVMARRYGDQSFKEGESCNLEEEMADGALGTDLPGQPDGREPDGSTPQKHRKKTRRDKERHINNPKLH